jgi:hypothetical protein
MPRSTACGAAISLAAVAIVVLLGVMVNELRYASTHPFRYGPAKVIAWTAGGGALIAAAVALLGFAVLHGSRATD